MGIPAGVTPGTDKFHFADPQSGQVGLFRTIAEHGHRVIRGLRLKIDNRKISEIEVIALREIARVFM
jgi:hypothetical protein